MNLKIKIAMGSVLAAALLSGCSGDQKRQKESKKTVPQPSYLSVRQWDKCLTSQSYRESDNTGWVGYCMPKEKAACCPQEAWDKLQAKNIPACPKNTGFKLVKPGYLSIQNWKSCMKTKIEGSWTSYCLPNKDEIPSTCKESTYQQIQNLKEKPTRCDIATNADKKSKVQQPEPDYLSIQNWKSCMKTKSEGSWTSYCLPTKATLPAACSPDTYDKIVKLKVKPAACASTE